MRIAQNRKNLVGQKFGELTVLYLYSSINHVLRWVCKCDCGKEKVIIGASITKGHTKSCGCTSHKRQVENTERFHGLRNTPEYSSWCGMRNRCNCKTHPNYMLYGGRGIKHSERWSKYSNFLEDMGKKPTPEHTLERIDVNGNYCKENCRWATRLEQSNNTRRNVFYEYNGKKLTVSAWAREYNIPIETVRSRIQRDGMSIGDALHYKKK